MKTPPISPELLALLCCPETRQPLAPAPDEFLARLESMRVAGRLRDCAGKEIDMPIHVGLLREDGALFFPIHDGLPMLVPEDAIVIDPLMEGGAPATP